MRFRPRLQESSDGEVLRRHGSNPILSPEHWPYPVNSVFNAGATLLGDEVLLLARVEDRTGVSHLTAARSRDGIHGWRIDPQPTLPADRRRYEESWGIEDPRITKVKDLYYVVYTGFSPAGPLVCLATTADFREFERHGALVPPDDKDAALFPELFGGRWCLIHRPRQAGASRASVWVSWSEDLHHWGDHQLVIQPRIGPFWDSDRVGLGPPPLLTEFGWLLMYHGVKSTVAGSIYRAGLAMVDAVNPGRILVRSGPWVLAPRHPYEHAGDVPQVVFPCGWVTRGDGELLIYYGVADTSIAVATARIDELIEFLYTNCACGRSHRPGEACDRAPFVGEVGGQGHYDGLRPGQQHAPIFETRL